MHKDIKKMYVQHNDITRMLKQNVQVVSKCSYTRVVFDTRQALSKSEILGSAINGCLLRVRGEGVWTLADNVC